MLSQDSGEILFSRHQPRGLKAGVGIHLSQAGVGSSSREMGLVDRIAKPPPASSPSPPRSPLSAWLVVGSGQLRRVRTLPPLCFAHVHYAGFGWLL